MTTRFLRADCFKACSSDSSGRPGGAVGDYRVLVSRAFPRRFRGLASVRFAQAAADSDGCAEFAPSFQRVSAGWQD
jgi:hypothetical protein